MPANFCLIPTEVAKFKQALKDGEIDPAELATMTSAERHAFFSNIVGEGNAKGVNALFESKTLLKNQQQGYITWAKKVTGITPEVRRDIISRIQKLDNVLDPAEEKQFLSDLAETRLGVGVSEEEARTIADLARKVGDTKDGTDRLVHGKAKVDLINYVGKLKADANKESLKSLAMHPGKTVSKGAGLAKSLKASLDDSAIFRQGFKTMITNPVIWQKNARQSFIDFARGTVGKEVLDEVKADIVSRPNYDRYVKARLAVSTIEETFPSTLPEKVPLLGNLYKGSETAFTAFAYRERADVFDKYIEIAKKTGVNIDDTAELKAIGKLVNSLTGRGHLGGLEPAANTVNSVFFSPRALKSNIDTLTAHQFQKNITPFARKQAAKATLKIIAGIAAILTIANAISPGSAELDPRSSDFGKIKVGNTRFDVAGGIESLVTLASRLITQSSKSSQTGEVKKLNSGIGSQTGVDVLVNFFENKLSPATSVLKDLIKQKDFKGDKPTAGGELKNLFAPLPATNVQELMGDPNSANDIVAGIADALGIATNTFGKSEADWNKDSNDALDKFRAKVGQEKFDQANKKFNEQYDTWTKNNKQAINKLPNDAKGQLYTDAKKVLQNTIMQDYGFSATKKPSKETLDGLLKAAGKYRDGQETTKQSILTSVAAYASAFKTSPGTAFNRIFTGQRILRTNNGAIIVERLPVSASQRIKGSLGGKNKEMKLDHTIPLELGGSNDKGNLKLVTTQQWASYSPVENYLGKQLKANKITAKEARRKILAFKNGTLKASDIIGH